MEEKFVKRSAITGKKYDVFDGVITIINPLQAAYYVSQGVDILDVQLSSDRKTGKPILTYLFKRDETKEVFDSWCNQRGGSW